MIELLDKRHNRDVFDCGNELLNIYLKHQAGQDMKRKLSACFVLSDIEAINILGYYTLSNSSIPSRDFPREIQKKFPQSYLSIPATLLGRLAIDINYQGRGIGNALLMDALERSYSLSKEMGSFAVFVDPIDPEAEKFYERYDFIELPASGKMIIPMKTLRELFD